MFPSQGAGGQDPQGGGEQRTDIAALTQLLQSGQLQLDQNMLNVLFAQAQQQQQQATYQNLLGSNAAAAQIMQLQATNPYAAHLLQQYELLQQQHQQQALIAAAAQAKAQQTAQQQAAASQSSSAHSAQHLFQHHQQQQLLVSQRQQQAQAQTQQTTTSAVTTQQQTPRPAMLSETYRRPSLMADFQAAPAPPRSAAPSHLPAQQHHQPQVAPSPYHHSYPAEYTTTLNSGVIGAGRQPQQLATVTHPTPEAIAALNRTTLEEQIKKNEAEKAAERARARTIGQMAEQQQKTNATVEVDEQLAKQVQAKMPNKLEESNEDEKKPIKEELTSKSDTSSEFATSIHQIPKWMEIVRENEEMLEKQRQNNPFRRNVYDKVLYHEPCEAPGIHELFEKHRTFRATLIEMLTNKERQKQAYHRIMNEKYELALETWKKNVNRWENSQKKIIRDAKHREIFERTFPELKKEREEKERQARCERTTRTAQEADPAISQEAQQQRLLNSATIPPLLLTENERRGFFRNDNTLVKDMSTVNEKAIENSLTKWTEEEKSLFTSRVQVVGKNFANIRQFMHNKTINDCVLFYYMSKQQHNYKQYFNKKKKYNKNKTYKPPAMPTSEELSLYKLVPQLTLLAPGAFGANADKCFMCSGFINATNPGQTIPKTNYSIYGFDPSTTTTDVRICNKCKSESDRLSQTNLCKVKSCAEGKRKIKATKNMPIKWRQLSERHRAFLVWHMHIPLEILRCCPQCFKRISNKMTQLENGELDELVSKFEEETQKKWETEEVNRLVKLVADFGKNWERVAENLPGRSAEECKEQYESAERDDERVGDEEDEEELGNDKPERIEDEMEEETQDVPESQAGETLLGHATSVEQSGSGELRISDLSGIARTAENFKQEDTSMVLDKRIKSEVPDDLAFGHSQGCARSTPVASVRVSSSNRPPSVTIIEQTSTPAATQPNAQAEHLLLQNQAALAAGQLLQQQQRTPSSMGLLSSSSTPNLIQSAAAFGVNPYHQQSSSTTPVGAQLPGQSITAANLMQQQQQQYAVALAQVAQQQSLLGHASLLQQPSTTSAAQALSLAQQMRQPQMDAQARNKAYMDQIAFGLMHTGLHEKIMQEKIKQDLHAVQQAELLKIQQQQQQQAALLQSQLNLQACFNSPEGRNFLESVKGHSDADLQYHLQNTNDQQAQVLIKAVLELRKNQQQQRSIVAGTGSGPSGSQTPVGAPQIHIPQQPTIQATTVPPSQTAQVLQFALQGQKYEQLIAHCEQQVNALLKERNQLRNTRPSMLAPVPHDNAQRINEAEKKINEAQVMISHLQTQRNSLRQSLSQSGGVAILMSEEKKTKDQLDLVEREIREIEVKLNQIGEEERKHKDAKKLAEQRMIIAQGSLPHFGLQAMGNELKKYQHDLNQINENLNILEHQKNTFGKKLQDIRAKRDQLAGHIREVQEARHFVSPSTSSTNLSAMGKQSQQPAQQAAGPSTSRMHQSVVAAQRVTPQAQNKQQQATSVAQTQAQAQAYKIPIGIRQPASELASAQSKLAAASAGHQMAALQGVAQPPSWQSNVDPNAKNLYMEKLIREELTGSESMKRKSGIETICLPQSSHRQQQMQGQATGAGTTGQAASVVAGQGQAQQSQTNVQGGLAAASAGRPHIGSSRSILTGSAGNLHQQAGILAAEQFNRSRTPSYPMSMMPPRPSSEVPISVASSLLALGSSSTLPSAATTPHLHSLSKPHTPSSTEGALQRSASALSVPPAADTPHDRAVNVKQEEPAYEDLSDDEDIVVAPPVVKASVPSSSQIVTTPKLITMFDFVGESSDGSNNGAASKREQSSEQNLQPSTGMPIGISLQSVSSTAFVPRPSPIPAADSVLPPTTATTATVAPPLVIKPEPMETSAPPPPPTYEDISSEED